jgi:hypothetical protein
MRDCKGQPPSPGFKGELSCGTSTVPLEIAKGRSPLPGFKGCPLDFSPPLAPPQAVRKRSKRNWPNGLLVAMTWEPEITLASIVLADRL